MTDGRTGLLDRLDLFRPERSRYPRRMTGAAPSIPEGGSARADRRRLRQQHIEAQQRSADERDAVLEASLEPGERVLARRRAHPVMTDRRILDARRLPSRRGEWVVDPLPFEEITRWTSGERHDHRPILKLEHRPLTRIDRVPARRFRWFTWGTAIGPVTRTTTSFGFGRRTNPILVAMRAELERRKIPEGLPFVIRPAGTREDRTKGSRGVLYKRSLTTGIRFRLWTVTHLLYRGRLAWPVRVISWLIVGVPAWFVAPWLVVPAVIATELAWIAALQWMWHRNRTRRETRSPERDEIHGSRR